MFCRWHGHWTGHATLVPHLPLHDHLHELVWPGLTDSGLQWRRIGDLHAVRRQGVILQVGACSTCRRVDDGSYFPSVSATSLSGVHIVVSFIVICLAFVLPRPDMF